jgi:hypothetical protein
MSEFLSKSSKEKKEHLYIMYCKLLGHRIRNDQVNNDWRKNNSNVL